MAAWAAFHPDVLVHVPGAPTPLVNQALCRAAREFCRRSYVWKAWCACTVTAPGERTYTATLPTDATPIRLEAYTLDGRARDVIPFTWHEADPDTFPEARDDGVTTADLATLTLVGPSIPDGDVAVRFALMPTRAAAGLPDFLTEQYLEGIAAGAARNLLTTRSAPWYDPAGASIPAGQFEDAIGRAVGDAARAHTRRYSRPAVHWC